MADSVAVESSAAEPYLVLVIDADNEAVLDNVALACLVKGVIVTDNEAVLDNVADAICVIETSSANPVS